MTSSLPPDRHEDRERFPRKPQVIYRPGPFSHPDDIQVQVPTETGDMVSILLRRTHPSSLDGRRNQYTFELSGELADIAPEALTAAVQVAFLALRSARAMELGVAEACERLGS